MPTNTKPHVEPFIIQRRPGWGAEIAVEIQCNPTDPSWVKLGLAVRVAYSTGARLDGARLVGASLDGASLVGASLDGASLDGARLDGASLVGASLDGASLVGARLDGALIRDKKINRLIAVVGRIEDAYIFNAFETDAGEIWISAGCRWFTPARYREHVASDYPNTTKAAETLDIINFIEMRAKAVIKQDAL